MILHLMHIGGPLEGQIVSVSFDMTPPVEIRYSTGEEVTSEDPRKVECAIYRIEEVQEATPPLRGYQGAAIYLRTGQSLPGLVHPV